MQTLGTTPKISKILSETGESLQISPPRSVDSDSHPSQLARGNSAEKRESVEHSQNLLDQRWCDISEAIDSDFLISPGDIYPNRKVELEDADIKGSNKEDFKILCEQQHEAFSKNNKDIGRTQLIEMEIDTGDNLPVAQSPYTLPLKHYDWVRQEIKTLEKSGVIERSLSKRASPVIVVQRNQHRMSHHIEDFASITEK